MATRTPIAQTLNVSQLTDLAVQSKQLAEAPIMTKLPAPTKVVDSTDDTTQVELYADESNVSEGPAPTQKSGDYFPINVDLGALGQTAPTTDPNALTEEEKRKRTIIIASVVLLVLIVLVSIIALKKRK